MVIEREKIHYQENIKSTLCNISINYIKKFTNDIDTVTCPFCLSLYKKSKKIRAKMKEENRLKEILNKKDLNKKELEDSLNYIECGYCGY